MQISSVFKNKATRRSNRLGFTQVTINIGIMQSKRLFRYSDLRQRTRIERFFGMGIDVHDQEGRLITLEYPEFYLVTCYTPNSQNELKRLDYRLRMGICFYDYLEELKNKTGDRFGDLNVAHENIDLKIGKRIKSAGFSFEERKRIVSFT